MAFFRTLLDAIKRPLLPLSVALAMLACIGFASAEPVRGAGSTFAAPVIGKWARLYKDARADGGDYFTLDWTVDYEPVGSLAGVMRLDEPEMDFAATDVPQAQRELKAKGRTQFPIVMGGIAIVANLEGMKAGQLKLTGPVLAEIFLGRIKSWSDPAIAAVNVGVALPDLPISIIRRQDGSGSTFVFTQYLAAMSDEWRSQVGADTLVKWPIGDGVEGTGNLLEAVTAKAGSISYAEYGQTLRAGLPFASLRNSAGNFVMPDTIGVQAAASAIDWKAEEGFNASLTNQSGNDAYPISTATFAVVPTDLPEHRYRRVQDFFRLAFEQGAEEAEALGYVPLPASLVALIEQDWAKAVPAGN